MVWNCSPAAFATRHLYSPSSSLAAFPISKVPLSSFTTLPPTISPTEDPCLDHVTSGTGLPLAVQGSSTRSNSETVTIVGRFVTVKVGGAEEDQKWYYIITQYPSHVWQPLAACSSGEVWGLVHECNCTEYHSGSMNNRYICTLCKHFQWVIPMCSALIELAWYMHNRQWCPTDKHTAHGSYCLPSFQPLCTYTTIAQSHTVIAQYWIWSA